MFHVEQRLTTVRNCFWRLGVVFSPRSLWEWWRVLRVHEDFKGSYKGRGRMLWRMFLGLVEIVFVSKVDGSRWHSRLAVCRGGWLGVQDGSQGMNAVPVRKPGCPIYDEHLGRCRPYLGSNLGCGCYVPIMALEERPYPRGCWAKQMAPESEFGWD